MTTSNPTVRRATIEDLPRLVHLWQQENLPWQELEKRFKEFQVAEANGEITGVLGLEISGLEGCLHSEVFAYPEQSDALREVLLERAKVVSQNHGLIRLWTQLGTPFWNRCGFRYADGELLSKLPTPFNRTPLPWQFLQLRDEVAAPASIEKEFAMFKEMEKERTDKIFRQAKTLKLVAAVIVMAVFVLLAFWVVAWFRARGQFGR